MTDHFQSRAILIVIVVFGVVALSGLSAADLVEDPFDLKNRDPRSPAPAAQNPMPPAVVAEPAVNPGEAWIVVNGQRILVKIDRIEPAGARKTADHIVFHTKVEPAVVAPGQVFKLTITGEPEPGFHTYPATMRADNPTITAVSVLNYKADGLTALWPMSETQPRWHKDRDSGSLLVHDDKFTWSQEFLVDPNIKPASMKLMVQISTQVCNEEKCTPLNKDIEVPVEVSGTSVPLSQQFKDRLQSARPEVQVVPPPTDGIGANSDILTILLASMGAAVAMLFTPCVFPMIPITVSFFIKKSEQKHHNAPLTAAVYSVTIIIVLALAVLLLGKLIVDWANSVWLNLGLAAVLMLFAFSLFGMYDIELPTFLTRWTSKGEGKGGYLGAVFMALTFTITSFTCTGPFLGPLLVAAKEMQLDLFRLILASVAYSATFAAPFFVLALFPGLLKQLPKSGGWLNAVKVVMGFLELGAALKFLGNADITFNGEPWLFTYDTVLVSWIALSVACGIYLLGVFRLPHDTPQEHIGVPRMVLATVFIGMGVYMAPALWRETPTGMLGQGLVAFLPPDTKPKAHEPYRDYEAAWKAAVRDNKLIFIDFTGVNCTNCRSNELNVFTRPAIKEELKNYVVVELYNDTVKGLKQPEATDQARRNLQWQIDTFGDASTPLYVILRPDPREPIKDGRIAGTEFGRYAGYIHDREAFLNILRNPGQVKPQ